MCIHVRTMYKLLDMRGKHTCTCTCTCMYMSKSMNHNSLGCEQPCIYHRGLNVKMANVHDAFLPIPGIISCAGVTGSGCITCHAHVTLMSGFKNLHVHCTCHYNKLKTAQPRDGWLVWPHHEFLYIHFVSLILNCQPTVTL